MQIELITMRYSKIILWSALLLIVGGMIGCDEEQVSPRVCAWIQIRSVSWSSWTPSENIESTNTYLACSSEYFGPNNGLFYAERVITNLKIEISFDENKVFICGESIANLLQYSTVYVTPDTVCFRTRTFDSGVDYYLWADGDY